MNAKIIDRSTGEVVAEIVTNHNMGLDTAIDLAGGICINDSEDPLWSDDEGNVIIDGKRYYWESLALE